MKITESYLRNIIKEELDNILKQNLSPIYESFESLKVDVKNPTEIKDFIKNNEKNKKFIEWLKMNNTTIETYKTKPGNFEGVGGLVDRYVATEQAKRRKGNN